jgi:cobaltochelatase CobN
LRALSRRGGPKIVVVPGEDRWDVSLETYATVPVETCRQLWRYFVEGGRENVRNALAFLDHLIAGSAEPDPPLPLPHAGLYWPGRGEINLDSIGSVADLSRPAAPIVFYRAVFQGGSTEPIDRLVEALAAEGITGFPIFVTSLKDRQSEEFLAEVFARFPPAVVLNTTSFAVSKIGGPTAGTVLDRPGRPVLQVVFAGSSEPAWREDARGFGPRDLTMNVVLPEVDGRLLTRAVSFKSERDGVSTYRSVPDRIAFVARQAAAWVRLAARPPSQRRVALVLSNYPDRDGRIGNGVGLDTPASAAAIGAAMAAAGYTLPGFPDTGAALMEMLLRGQTNARTSPRTPPSSSGLTGGPVDLAMTLAIRGGGEWSSAFAEDDNGVRDEGRGPVYQPQLPLADYNAFLVTLPESIRAALTARWGPPERDPFFADGAFRLAVHRFGNVVVGIQPQRGYSIDPKATYHDPDLVPPHHYLAFYAWLRMSLGADAIVHVGKHGNLEWLPGKALGLSQSCWPEVALGTVPVIYSDCRNPAGLRSPSVPCR